MKKIFLISLIVFINIIAFSQSNFSYKATLFGVNPTADPNKPLYKGNIFDTTGFFTIHPGFQLSAEIFGCKTVSAKIIQAYTRDQVGFHSGYTQVLINLYIVKNRTNFWKFGFGPAVHYRKNWSIIPTYVDEGYYYDYFNTQYKMNWLSFELEYGWRKNKDFDYVVSISQMYPRSVGLYFGMKYWFTRRNMNCSTCPSY